MSKVWKKAFQAAARRGRVSNHTFLENIAASEVVSRLIKRHVPVDHRH